jgi:hypothetical protein
VDVLVGHALVRLSRNIPVLVMEDEQIFYPDGWGGSDVGTRLAIQR